MVVFSQGSFKKLLILDLRVITLRLQFILGISSLGLDFLRPNGGIGFVLLITGIFVTVISLYVFYNVISDVDSVLDKQRKKEAKDLQKEKILRLYPKK